MGGPIMGERGMCHGGMGMGRYRMEMHEMEHGMMGHHGFHGGMMEEECRSCLPYP